MKRKRIEREGKQNGEGEGGFQANSKEQTRQKMKQNEINIPLRKTLIVLFNCDL